MNHAATPCSDAGFTLIELILVVTLIGLASVVGALSLSGSLAAKRVETSAWAMGSVLQRARSLAVQSGRPSCFKVDVASGRYWVEEWREDGEKSEEGRFAPLATLLGEPQSLAERVLIERMVPDEGAAVIFDRWGRTSGPVRIQLANPRGDQWTVAMGAVSGRVAVLPGVQDPFGIMAQATPDGADMSDLPPLFSAPPVLP